jgi:hypothetical protein
MTRADERRANGLVERDARGRVIRHVAAVLPADPDAGRPKPVVIGSDRSKGVTDPLSVFSRARFLRKG